MKHHSLIDQRISQLLQCQPFLEGFFEAQGLDVRAHSDATVREVLDRMDDQEREDKALQVEVFAAAMDEYIAQMRAFLGEEDLVTSLTILPGTDKSGRAESFDALTIKRNEVICIVGSTGSGKSRLLGDIEWVAQGDTPTGRRILINGRPPQDKWRFSTSDKLVAQLSQNMNFVMDLTVGEFIALHAESRLVAQPQEIVARIIDQANRLAGERFDLDTPITSLSGGQSRALMIADTAILSKSPIILIDEIENAGIDRKKALDLLLAEEKIVLMATHDPLLTLMGHRRIVIRGGGIQDIIATSDAERALLGDLESMDHKIQTLRHQLRLGERLAS